MTNPDYGSLSIKEDCLVDTWTNSNPYIEPIQTDMDGGNKRLRTRPGDELTRIQFSIMYTQTEYLAFKTFVLTTLNKGTSRFTMNVWDGTQKVSKTVQFAAAYKPVTNFPVIVVAFDLYVYGGL